MPGRGKGAPWTRRPAPSLFAHKWEDRPEHEVLARPQRQVCPLGQSAKHLRSRARPPARTVYKMFQIALFIIGYLQKETSKACRSPPP